jgi:predicted DNA-binding transcriptional regulator AlpA
MPTESRLVASENGASPDKGPRLNGLQVAAQPSRMPASHRWQQPANDNVPRLVTKKEAAAYCGVSVPTFTKWVSLGIMPSSAGLTRRWDRRTIDAVLDDLGGLSARPSEDAFDKWKRARNAKRTAGDC